MAYANPQHYSGYQQPLIYRASQQYNQQYYQQPVSYPPIHPAMCDRTRQVVQQSDRTQRRDSQQHSYEEQEQGRNPVIFYCLQQPCASQGIGFARKADLQRHVDVTHNRANLRLHSCEFRGHCHRRGEYGFTRRDKMVDHLREVHKISIPKRRGSTTSSKTSNADRYRRSSNVSPTAVAAQRDRRGSQPGRQQQSNRTPSLQDDDDDESSSEDDSEADTPPEGY